MVNYCIYFLWYSRWDFNYIYGGDINNDGSPTNDLIYVPTTARCKLWSLTQFYTFSNAQRAAYDNFISQDSYLSGREGSMLSVMVLCLLGGNGI
jgi:hypothetical protein